MTTVRTKVLICVTAYLGCLTSVWLVLHSWRNRVVPALSSQSAQDDWLTWQQRTTEPPPGDPVRRRAVLSREPPALILLRDHYPAVLTTCLVIASFLCGFLGIVLRGAFWRARVDTCAKLTTDNRELTTDLTAET